jgi:ATP-dependent Clp protease ATP-binding subunit ClpA
LSNNPPRRLSRNPARRPEFDFPEMSDHLERLRGLEAHLLSRVIGQDDAVRRTASALVGSELGLNDTGPRPKGSFLFMGPSGVGKTETSKVFTDFLFGGARLAMFYMGGMQDQGHAEALVSRIARTVEAHPQGTTLLFDEFEKAAQPVIDVFLSLLDEGKADGVRGERVSIQNCYVVMTSNVGSADFGKMEQLPYSRMERFAFDEARAQLRPELFNRIDETIVFRPLSQEVQVGILSKLLSGKLSHIERKLAQDFGPLPWRLTIDGKGVNAHLLRMGFSQDGGARRLERELDRQFTRAVTPWILNGRLPGEGRFYCNVKEDCLELR